MGLGLSYRKLDESERMRRIVEQHVSRGARKRGAFQTWAPLTAILANKALTRSIPNKKARYLAAAALALLGGAGASALQGKITDLNIRRLEDAEAKHLKLGVDVGIDIQYLKNIQKTAADNENVGQDYITRRGLYAIDVEPRLLGGIGLLHGAAGGGLIGSAVAPGLGTTIGAGIGALTGGITGYLAGRKHKKSVFDALQNEGINTDSNIEDLRDAYLRLHLKNRGSGLMV